MHIKITAGRERVAIASKMRVAKFSLGEKFCRKTTYLDRPTMNSPSPLSLSFFLLLARSLAFFLSMRYAISVTVEEDDRANPPRKIETRPFRLLNRVYLINTLNTRDE